MNAMRRTSGIVQRCLGENLASRFQAGRFLRLLFLILDFSFKDSALSVAPTCRRCRVPPCFDSPANDDVDADMMPFQKISLIAKESLVDDIKSI